MLQRLTKVHSTVGSPVFRVKSWHFTFLQNTDLFRFVCVICIKSSYPITFTFHGYKLIFVSGGGGDGSDETAGVTKRLLAVLVATNQIY